MMIHLSGTSWFTSRVKWRTAFRSPTVSKPAKSAMVAYLQRGINFLSDDQKRILMNQGETRRTLQADKDTVGGFMLANEKFSFDIIQDLHDQTFVMDFAKIILEPYAMSVSWPVFYSTVDDSNWTSELRTGSEDTGMDFEKITLTPKPLAKRVKISETLVRKSGGNAERLIQSELGYKFGITCEKLS